MKEYKNEHEGKRAFIVGNGPSLQKTPLEKLNNEITLAMNKIDIIYDETSWRPKYYICDDIPENSNKNIQEHKLLKHVQNNTEQSTSFLNKKARQYFDEADNVNFYNGKDTGKWTRKKAIKSKNISEVWSNKVAEIVYNCGSTISIAAQIANYMGCNKIYFIGCDLYDPSVIPSVLFKNASDTMSFHFDNDSVINNLVDYTRSTENTFRSIINAIYFEAFYKPYSRINNLLSSGVDKHHFSDLYSQDPIVNTYRINRKFREVHQVIKIASDYNKFEVYNATVGGYLDVYERSDIENIV